ncbi:arsenosugar biosynthesis radical SAM (seleno)protein ArsS [Thermodesulfobacteriota bacterium]
MAYQEPLQKVERGSDTGDMGTRPFHRTLSSHGLSLERGLTTTLQINVGFACNQTCQHCHLSAGPDRKEHMDLETVDEVVSYARRSHFKTIDLTGGAPELNPHITGLIERLSSLTQRIMFRSNLSLFEKGERDQLLDLLKSCRAVIVASLPSLNRTQANSQRGNGCFERTINVLKRLNAMGYGQKGAGLDLDLVSNPTGSFLPPNQAQTEKRFHQVLEQKWGIVFNNLFNFGNAPLGRFRRWLINSGNFEKYMEKLVSGFNPCAVKKLMCRTLVSVSWDGYLYDCDFNLSKRLFMGGRKTHVSEMPGPPEPGTAISVEDHCYICTAGAGFT